MSSIFPLRPQVTPATDREPVLVAMDDDDADELFSVLSATTTRQLLGSLYEEPASASKLADVHDTSIQNASYHLGKLEDAGLVEVSGTWYSKQGNEMKVYTPTHEPLVLFASESDSHDRLRQSLMRFVGAIGLLTVLSVLVGRLYQWLVIPTTTPTLGDVTTTVPVAPALLVFIGGLFVLLIVALWDRVR